MQTTSNAQRLLGQIAIDLGFLRPEDLELAVELQGRLRSAGKSYSLGEILVDHGFLTSEELAKILEAQRSDTAVAVPLGDLIVSNELATREQVDECLTLQKRLRDTDGKKVPLATLLLKKGYIDQQKKNALLRLQDRLGRARTGAAPATAPAPAQREPTYGLKKVEDDVGPDLAEKVLEDDLYGSPTPETPKGPPPSQAISRAAAPPQQLRAAPQIVSPGGAGTGGLDVQLFEDEKRCESCGEIMLATSLVCGECDARYCSECGVHIGRSLDDLCPRCLARRRDSESAGRARVETARQSLKKRQERTLAIAIAIGAIVLVLGIVGFVIFS